MIKDNNNYLYLIVPNEYRCVYYNILDTLGTLGEDLLSSCTATCKGRAISGFACYNMFIAACAAYYLGQVKKARVLISYIKAQLEINCNKILIFEDSLSDEWIFLTVPNVYQCVFEKLLNKLAAWGQELLDDCTVSCKGQNRNILNAWNLFNAACIAYDTCDKCKADYIIDYIKGLLGFNCPDEEPTFKEPSLKNFVLNTEYKENGPVLDILDGTVDIENIDSIVPNSMKLINSSTGDVLAENLSVSELINFDIRNLPVQYSSTINFVLQVTGTDGKSYYSNVYSVNIPDEPEHFVPPVLHLLNVDYEISPDNQNPANAILTIKGFTATCENIESINSDGLNLSMNEIYDIITNITPQNNVQITGLTFNRTVQNNTTVPIVLSCVGKDNITYKSSLSINIVLPVSEKIVYSGYVDDDDIPLQLTEAELLAYGVVKQELPNDTNEFDTSEGQGTKLLIIVPSDSSIVSVVNNNFSGDYIEELLTNKNITVGTKNYICYEYEVPIIIDNTYHVILN